MSEQDSMPKAKVFLVPNIACPHCGDVYEIDGDPMSGAEETCLHCDKEFIAVGEEYSMD